MSLPTPQISQLRQTSISQLEGELGQSDPSLPKAVIRVIGTVWAGLIVIVYKYAGWIFLQLFVRYASFRETTVNGRVVVPLRLHGDEYGVPPPDEGATAKFLARVTPITLGSTLKANTAIVDRATQRIYKTTTDTILTVNPTSVEVAAVAPGAAYNVTTSTALHFVSPLPNAQRELGVLSIVTQGADAETEEAYRQRVQEWKQAPAQGGAHADYARWAKEVSGIVNVYPYNNGPRRVRVYCEATQVSSGSADGIPTNAQLTAVNDRFNLSTSGVASRRPINARTEAVAIGRKSLNIEVQGLVVADPATVQPKIEAAADEYIRSCEPYILGLTLPPRRDVVRQADVAGAVGEIVRAAQGTFTAVLLLDGSTPISIYSLGQGERAKLNQAFFT